MHQKTVTSILPEEDFCLYKDFPFNQLIIFYKGSKLIHTYTIHFTTLMMMRKLDLIGGARGADARRTRHPRHRCELLARHLGAGRHAAGGHCQAQRRHPRGFGDPGVQERFKKLGQEIWPSDQQTPGALAAKQKAEIAKWTPIIRQTMPAQ